MFITATAQRCTDFPGGRAEPRMIGCLPDGADTPPDRGRYSAAPPVALNDRSCSSSTMSAQAGQRVRSPRGTGWINAGLPHRARRPRSQALAVIRRNARITTGILNASESAPWLRGSGQFRESSTKCLGGQRSGQRSIGLQSRLSVLCHCRLPRRANQVTKCRSLAAMASSAACLLGIWV